MKQDLIMMAVVSTALFVSCEKKSPEVKAIEKASSEAVASGALSKEDAKALDKAVEKASDLQGKASDLQEKAANLQEQAKTMITDQLAKLDKASTVDEIRAAIKDASKANAELAVKNGLMTQEQLGLVDKGLEAIDALPEAQLKAAVEQLKAQLHAAQGATK